MATPYRLILFDCFNTLYVQDASRLPGLLVDGSVKPTTVPVQHARIVSRFPDLDPLALYRAHREARRRAEARREQPTRELVSRERFEYVVQLLGLPGDGGLVDDLMDAHYDALISTFRFPDEHRRLLDGLRREYRLALFSNFDHAPPLRVRLARDGLMDWLDPVVISAELGWRKPGREAFSMALEQVAEEPARILFVGDSFGDDVVGACDAGIDCAWINAGASGAEWIPPSRTGGVPDPSGPPGVGEARPTFELRALTDLPGALAGCAADPREAPRASPGKG